MEKTGGKKLTKIIHQELDPDPFFPHADPRIRIRINMMQIHNTALCTVN